MTTCFVIAIAFDVHLDHPFILMIFFHFEFVYHHLLRVLTSVLYFNIWQDQPERATRILAKMRQKELRPNIRTYELMFSLFGCVNAPYESGNMKSHLDAAKRISVIEADMLKNGIRHSSLSIANLVGDYLFTVCHIFWCSS